MNTIPNSEYAESSSSRSSSQERRVDQLKEIIECTPRFEAMKDKLMDANIDWNSIPSLDKDEFRLDPETNIKMLLNNPDDTVRNKIDEMFGYDHSDADASESRHSDDSI